MPATRILVCDDISEHGLDLLRLAGFELLYRRGIALEDIPAAAEGCAAMLVRSRTRVGAQLLDRLPALRLLGRAGFGVDTIDVEAASRQGVFVMHSAEGNATTAAEFTIGLLFALARHIPQADASLRAGRWDKRRFRGMEITGKTLGVLGMGRVGRGVVERATALKMRVLVYDPMVLAQEIEAAGGVKVGWDDVLLGSDFLTVHVAPGTRTHNLIDDAAFERMKDGVRLINTTRGHIVDEGALVRAIRSGKVAGAAVDTFEHEPPVGSALLGMPQVVVTPHIVASTFEAQIHVAHCLAEQVRDFFLHGDRRGVLNPGIDPRRGGP
jgi:D-3-phosphoglycerate dehydrogenase